MFLNASETHDRMLRRNVHAEKPLTAYDSGSLPLKAVPRRP